MPVLKESLARKPKKGNELAQNQSMAQGALIPSSANQKADHAPKNCRRGDGGPGIVMHILIDRLTGIAHFLSSGSLPLLGLVLQLFGGFLSGLLPVLSLVFNFSRIHTIQR